MAQLFDTATKQPAEVPDADAPSAVLSGRYGLKSGQKVMLYRPDGQAVTVPAESAPEAFQKGYKYAPQTDIRAAENEEKYGALGSKLLSSGASALRGVSLGLSDRALRNLGVEAETLRDLNEGAPLLSGVSEVAGGVLGIALSGGASGAGRAAAGATGLAGKGLLGRAAAKAVELGTAGAIEGAAFGGGKTVSEDALGRADLNAESLLANAGLGAVFGGGAGLLIGGGGSLAGDALRAGAKSVGGKLGSGGVKQWLEDFAGERALKATLGQQKKAFTQLEDKGLVDKAEKYLLDEIGLGKDGLLEAGGNTTEVIAERLATRRDALNVKRAGFVTKLDDATKENFSARVRSEVIADRIESEIIANLDPVAEKATVNAMKEVADGYRAQPGPRSFAEQAGRRAKAQKNANFDAAVPRPTQKAWADVARLWNDEIDNAAEPILKSLGEQTGNAYKAAREEFSLVQRLTDYAENRVQGNAANRFVSPSDYGVGGIAGVMTGDPLTGAVAALGNKVVRERGNAFAANVAYKLSRLQAIQKASAAVEGRINSAVTGFLDRSARGGVAQAVSPAATQILLDTSFMPKAAAAKAPSDRRDAAKQRSREIAELMADPVRVADRVATSLAGLDESAPGISGQAALTATKALQHLSAKAPKPMQSSNTLQPLLDEWKPSEQEASRFERHVRAALDPMSVLDDLGAGTLTNEAAETFRELYPKLHEMTFQKISSQLATSKKKLPYADRVNLSLLLGVPVDDSMEPGFISRTQAMWKQKPTEGGGRQAPSPGSLDLAVNLASPTQKLEAKR